MRPMWIVTLVCGASGVGKSRVAAELARRYGAPLAATDDVVTALKALTTPAQAPALHRWDTDPATRGWPPRRIAAHTIAVAEALRPGFAALIADRLAAGAAVVLEGDHLLPDLAGPGVRAVVLSEPDEGQILANYRAREPAEGDQRARAAVSALVDAGLRARAVRAGVPVVPARPWESGPGRADAAMRVNG